MNPTISKLILYSALLLLHTSNASADAAPGIDFKAGIGYLHDSNVSLTELDTSTGEADQATRFELGINGNIPVSQQLSLKGSYGFTQTRYAEFSDFDTALHRLEGSINWRIAGFDSALSMRHFAAQLDGERFLDIRQVSPSIARLIGGQFYLRGAFTGSEKLYAENDVRDASNQAIDVDAYWLLDGMNRYIAAGIRYDDENAEAAEFDYSGNRYKLTFGQAIGKATLKARVQLERRDYLNVNEQIDAARRDERLQAGFNLEVPLTEYLSLNGDARYSDYRSNLESASYDETVYTITLAATF